MVEYLPRSVSDHSPVRVQLVLGQSDATPILPWRVNPFWVQLIDKALLGELQEFFQLNAPHSPPPITWDAMKAVTRGLYIREISKRKSKTRELTQALQQRVADTEVLYISDPTDRARADWTEAQDMLKNHMLSVADNKRFFLKQKYFMEGESAGHLLATIVRSQQGPSHIARLVRDDGAEITGNVDVLNEMRSFYEQLYTSRFEGDSEDLAGFLAQIQMPSLTPDSRQVLEQPLTLAELELALQMAPNDKAPGIDGLPSEFFKLYRDELLPPLLTVFQEAAATGCLPSSMREATIVLIPKPGKDPSLPGSYRPISLLPVDIKLLAKVLALRLSTVITEVIHDDQSGFMPNKSTAVNIRRLFLNLQLSNDDTGGRAILSLDAAKAFDSVEWTFLWAVLHKLGFGPQFLSWVRLLYSAPVARIRTNGLISEPFALHRGTRQGCPLSPLLFSIAIEPLACLIRSAPDIVGFRIGALEERISLYADDMLLYLGNMTSSITPVMSIITEFGKWSGLLINWDKSVLMPLDPVPPSFSPQSVPLQIVSNFQYLGIVVNSRPKDYIALNLVPILAKLSSKVDTWCRLPLSVIGRGNLIKMIFMPQLLYILHNSPILIPAHFFKKINRIFRELIWQKKYPRIRLETLQRDKADGGLAIPNPWLYYLAAQMQHFVGWSREDNMSTAGKLFSHWSGRRLPCYELESGGTPDSRRLYPTLALMYKVWDRGKTSLGVTGFSKYTPLWSNPSLVEISKLRGFDCWSGKGIHTLEQVQQDGHLKSFDALQAAFGLPHQWFYQFLQLRHAFAAQLHLGDVVIHSNGTIDALLGASVTKGVISTIYQSLLQEHLKSFPLRVREKWASDIGPISDEQWDSVLELTPTLSPSEAQRLSQLFLLHRSYKSPSVLFKIGAWANSECPRCNLEDAHLLHMFWECTALGNFWNGVLEVIHEVYQLRLPTTPHLCVLGILDDLDSDSPILLGISRMLFQARKLIAQHWLRPSPPTRREYITRLNNIIRLEKGVYIKRKAMHKFEKVWGPWLDTPSLPSQILLSDRVRFST